MKLVVPLGHLRIAPFEVQIAGLGDSVRMPRDEQGNATIWRARSFQGLVEKFGDDLWLREYSLIPCLLISLQRFFLSGRRVVPIQESRISPDITRAQLNRIVITLGGPQRPSFSDVDLGIYNPRLFLLMSQFMKLGCTSQVCW